MKPYQVQWMLSVLDTNSSVRILLPKIFNISKLFALEMLQSISIFILVPCDTKRSFVDFDSSEAYYLKTELD